MEKAVIDLGSLLADTAALLRHSPELKADHYIVEDYPAESVLYEGDPNQIRQICWNLARNAIQALETRAPNDPARDQVRITGRREGAVAVIEVSDTGPGFPARAREHLFEAFQSTERSGGTGLGLAIAAELVRAHGGEIKLVEGTIGATFRLTIPDRAVELDAHRSARARA